MKSNEQLEKEIKEAISLVQSIIEHQPISAQVHMDISEAVAKLKSAIAAVWRQRG